MMIRASFNYRIKRGRTPFSLNASIEIANGEMVILSGPSGSGKTTLLRILAGLVKPERGQIAMNGEAWQNSAKRSFLHTSRRNIAMVFQDYALFPDRTVIDNILFSCENKALGAELIQHLDLVELTDRFPGEISGGQKQRVALARALARQSSLLLLDEPFSSQDPLRADYMQWYIYRYWKEHEPTIVMVTHGTSGILYEMARVISLEEGRIAAPDIPSAIVPDVRTFENWELETEVDSDADFASHEELLDKDLID